jgi:ATP-dependent RNA helicase DHX29
MGKKKKTQLKPVARGFATTSMPSKKSVAAAQEKEVEETISTEAVGDDRGLSGSNKTIEDKIGGLNEEEVALQSLVDKWQEKTEKEVGRTLKVWDLLLRDCLWY